MIQKAYRTRLQPIRTISELQVRIIIPVETTVTLYKRISQKAKELKTLGMTFEAIAEALKISKNTVRRALRYKG